MFDRISHQHDGKPTNYRERTCFYSETCSCGSTSMCLQYHLTAVPPQPEANSQTADVKTSVDNRPRIFVVPVLIAPLPRMCCRLSCRYHLRRGPDCGCVRFLLLDHFRFDRSFRRTPAAPLIVVAVGFKHSGGLVLGFLLYLSSLRTPGCPAWDHLPNLIR